MKRAGGDRRVRPCQRLLVHLVAIHGHLSSRESGLGLPRLADADLLHGIFPLDCGGVRTSLLEEKTFSLCAQGMESVQLPLEFH